MTLRLNDQGVEARPGDRKGVRTKAKCRVWRFGLAVPTRPHATPQHGRTLVQVPQMVVVLLDAVVVVAVVQEYLNLTLQKKRGLEAQEGLGDDRLGD